MNASNAAQIELWNGPAIQLAMQVGPSGSALAAASGEVQAAAAERLRAELAPHQQDGRVALGGAMRQPPAVRPAARASAWCS